jgi:voltage-gated potassium channel
LFGRVLYEIFVILLVITYAIIVFTDPADHPLLTDELLHRIDLMLIGFLLVEYAVGLWRAKEKGQFILRNWFDLIAMIPFDHYFYLARFMRIFRLIRVLRASPLMWGVLHSQPMRRVFAIASLIMLWSSTGIYLLESGVNKNITDFGDALWWSIVTSATVGYGDISPVTTGGRIMAVILMITGIGLLGALTANFATHWTEYFEQKEETEGDRIRKELKQSAIRHLQQIERLSPEEYDTLIKTIELLYHDKKEQDKSC